MVQLCHAGALGHAPEVAGWAASAGQLLVVHSPGQVQDRAAVPLCAQRWRQAGPQLAGKELAARPRIARQRRT